MCEQAAEAQKSKGSVSRRNRTSSDLGPNKRDSVSVDAILPKNTTIQSQSSVKIYLINCLSAIQQPLVGHDVAANYVNNLRTMIDMHVNLLAEREVEAILRRCGLLDKMSYMQKNEEGHDDTHGSLAEVEEMSPQVLSECLRTFFGLVTGNDGTLPEFEQLQDPRLRSDACLLVAKALSGAYELLYLVINDPVNCYPDPKSLARHSPDQIRTILEI